LLVIGRAAPPNYYLAPGIDEAAVPAIDATLGTRTWLGGGARGLGLAGRVDPDALTAVLGGRKPGGHRPLASRPATIQGFDLTFSAPKSVSLLVALGPTDVARAVAQAHGAAVAATMHYMDHRAVTVRRRDCGQRIVLGSDGSIAAVFTHGVSRALDPHLHSHVVVANLAHGEDGRWSAIDSRGLFAHRSTADALYQAHLRHALTRALGVRWEDRGTTRFELAGVDPTASGLLSNRSVAMRTHLARLDPPGAGAGAGPPARGSPRARHIAWASTRDPKETSVDATALRQRWSRIAASSGFGPTEIRVVLDRRHVPAANIDERRFAVALIASCPSSTNRRSVVGAWAASIADGAAVADAERSADWVLRAPAPGRASHQSDHDDAAERVPAGVAEPSRALAGVVPPGYLVRSLGARPVAEHHQRTWRAAADTIDRYRTRWDVRDRADALGPDNALCRLPTRQLADRVRAGAQVEGARARLGRHQANPPERLNEPERLNQLGPVRSLGRW
jgi:conjugative relaxase-like TrwC/TraI family protein